MNTTTEFQLVDIDKLVPYVNNARTHNKEQILKRTDPETSLFSA